MNEHIAHLAEKAAQESALLDNDTNLEVSYLDKTFYIPANFIETFAQLIVGECMTICEDVTERNDPAIACYYEIRKHFGVEK